MNTPIEIDWIKRWALYSPEHTAIESLSEDLSLSYSELNIQISKRVSLLKETFGIQEGDRVAMLAMNQAEHIIVFFALQRIGAILLPLNYRLAAPEIRYQLEDSSAKLLIYAAEFKEKISSTSSCKTVALESDEGWIEHAKSSAPYKNENISEDVIERVCMILYTSGTTGKPKGAMITNKMLFWNSISTCLRLNLTQQEVILTFAPFFHTGGWNVLTTPVLHRGGTVILTQKFEAEETLRLCDEKGVTILFGVPTMMQMMADAPNFDSTQLSKIRYAIVGGEPISIPLIERWHEKEIPIRQGYGLTEFGPNVFSLNENDAIRKKGSIGFANFYIDTRVVDDNENNCQVNEIGELWLRGPACTPGYWNNLKATSQAIENGWFKTGDLVRFDEEGYFYVVDRKKDLFISGAENVYPAEIEAVLRSHPMIKEVAVIGVPDERWGEVGAAFVVLNEHQNDFESILSDYCREQLAKYKVPKYFKEVSELPKSDSGKILKRKLKLL